VDVTSGEVLVNGAKSKMKDLTKLVGFVPQDDILLGMLTVKEILRFHAHLRLPIHIGISIREGWIDNCIDLLGLTDVKHSLVGDATQRGISGGQRRRVNIGAELVSDPSILFLDEPTSGLDSSAALEVMRCLQLAANEGMTVCCVIHQPRTSVYELFDDLLLLGRSSARYGGRTVYYGPAADATAYFEGLHFHFPVKENPADVFIDIVSGNKQPETTANSALSAAVEEEVVVDEPSIDVVMKPLADLWDEHYLKNDPNAPARESDESSLMEDEGLSSPKGRKMRKMTLSSLKSLGDTRLAYRTMESALANLSVRLRDHQGRHTPNYFIQFLLFMDRQVTQLCRRFPIVLKNVIMFVIAGLILGALYSDVLDDWPDGGNGYCDDEKYDDGDSRSKSNCGRHGDDDPELQPHMEQGDCLHRIWPAIESDMDINYRQVFTLALLGMALLSVQSSLDLFGEERLIFLRESRHHMAWTYACGKMVAATPLSFLYPFCFTAVFHTLFNPMASFSDYYWTFMMTGLASEGLGIFLSIAFPDTRQVAGGVFALVMAMFTGCFPLFADGGSTRGVGFFSFLRYSAQLLFRFEYLAYVGLLPKFGCAKSGTYESESSCLKPKGFDRNSFWLPPDSPSEYNTTFQDCPLPWDYYGHYGNETISINDDDDYEKKHNDDDQWDVQCCSVNLYFKIKDLMRDDYGYVMHPDFSFLKLLAFSAAFRFAGILILAWKDLAKRR
jgi:ABC-type multidrug transport system ATPase subunit